MVGFWWYNKQIFIIMQVSENLAKRAVLTIDSSYQLALLYFTETTRKDDLSYKGFFRSFERLVYNFDLICKSKFTIYKDLERCSSRLDEVRGLKLLIDSRFQKD